MSKAVSPLEVSRQEQEHTIAGTPTPDTSHPSGVSGDGLTPNERDPGSAYQAGAEPAHGSMDVDVVQHEPRDLVDDPGDRAEMEEFKTKNNLCHFWPQHELEALAVDDKLQ